MPWDRACGCIFKSVSAFKTRIRPEYSTEECKCASAAAAAWSQYLAAALKYHSKQERVRGDSGTPQPWAAVSINACFWQTAHWLHQNAGWQAGGVSYPQIVIIIYKKQLQKKKKTLYLKMNGKIKKIVRYESQTSVVQVTLERRQVHRICILIRFVCTLINVVLLRSKTHLYLLTVPTVDKDRCLTS